jgi:hypothetical protein
MSERDLRFEAVRSADDGWVTFIADDGHPSIAQRGPRSYDERLLDILKAADDADHARGIFRIDLHSNDVETVRSGGDIAERLAARSTGLGEPLLCECGHAHHEHGPGQGEFAICGHEVTPPKRGRSYGDFCPCDGYQLPDA